MEYFKLTFLRQLTSAGDVITFEPAKRFESLASFVTVFINVCSNFTVFFLAFVWLLALRSLSSAVKVISLLL